MWYNLRMENENLYQHVKNKIYDAIFKGLYSEGEKIPSERELAEVLGVSRVTVRKSLELLEREQLLIREVGRGTRVCFHNYGVASNLEMIVLIAPAKNPFFSEFIKYFQEYAEQRDSLVLYVEIPKKESLEACLYRLFTKGMKNVVIWLEARSVNCDKLKILRALGMNMVFFDSDKGIPFADCVTIDNELAIKSLFCALVNKGYEYIGYVGWNCSDVYSMKKREEAFLLAGGTEEAFLRIPREYHNEGESFLLLNGQKYFESGYDAIICSDGENGVAAAKALKKMHLNTQVSSIDKFPESKALEIITYQQDFERIVTCIFQCLENQNSETKKWKAKIHMLEGELES